MQRDHFKTVGIVLIGLSTLMSVLYPILHRQVVGFFELYLARDHAITVNGQRELSTAFYFGMVLCLVGGYCFLKAHNENWLSKVRKVFLEEPLTHFTRIHPSPRFVLMVSPLAGLFLILVMRIAYNNPALYVILYQKDHGVFDLGVPTIVAFSAVLLVSSVLKIWTKGKTLQHRRILLGGYSFFAALFVFYAGEETSWGQDFFKWQTPALFSGNVEHQTNIHNFFNAYFDTGYIALSLILAVVMGSILLAYHRRWVPFNRFFLPHPSLIGLGLMIGFVSLVWFQEQELLEEMVAVFILFYCVRIFACFRSRNLAIESEKN